MRWEAGTSYRLWYQSGSGRMTERTIDLIGLRRSSEGVVYLRAYCHLRGEDRTFRADRILYAEPLPRATVGSCNPASSRDVNPAPRSNEGNSAGAVLGLLFGCGPGFGHAESVTF